MSRDRGAGVDFSSGSSGEHQLSLAESKNIQSQTNLLNLLLEKRTEAGKGKASTDEDDYAWFMTWDEFNDPNNIEKLREYYRRQYEQETQKMWDALEIEISASLAASASDSVTPQSVSQKAATLARDVAVLIGDKEAKNKNLLELLPEEERARPDARQLLIKHFANQIFRDNRQESLEQTVEKKITEGKEKYSHTSSLPLFIVLDDEKFQAFKQSFLPGLSDHSNVTSTSTTDTSADWMRRFEDLIAERDGRTVTGDEALTALLMQDKDNEAKNPYRLVCDNVTWYLCYLSGQQQDQLVKREITRRYADKEIARLVLYKSFKAVTKENINPKIQEAIDHYFIAEEKRKTFIKTSIDALEKIPHTDIFFDIDTVTFKSEDNTLLRGEEALLEMLIDEFPALPGYALVYKNTLLGEDWYLYYLDCSGALANHCLGSATEIDENINLEEFEAIPAESNNLLEKIQQKGQTTEIIALRKKVMIAANTYLSVEAASELPKKEFKTYAKQQNYAWLFQRYREIADEILFEKRGQSIFEHYRDAFNNEQIPDANYIKERINSFFEIFDLKNTKNFPAYHGLALTALRAYFERQLLSLPDYRRKDEAIILFDELETMLAEAWSTNSAHLEASNVEAYPGLRYTIYGGDNNATLEEALNEAEANPHQYQHHTHAKADNLIRQFKESQKRSGIHALFNPVSESRMDLINRTTEDAAGNVVPDLVKVPGDLIHGRWAQGEFDDFRHFILRQKEGEAMPYFTADYDRNSKKEAGAFSVKVTSREVMDAKNAVRVRYDSHRLTASMARDVVRFRARLEAITPPAGVTERGYFETLRNLSSSLVISGKAVQMLDGHGQVIDGGRPLYLSSAQFPSFRKNALYFNKYCDTKGKLSSNKQLMTDLKNEYISIIRALIVDACLTRLEERCNNSEALAPIHLAIPLPDDFCEGLDEQDQANVGKLFTQALDSVAKDHQMVEKINAGAPEGVAISNVADVFGGIFVDDRMLSPDELKNLEKGQKQLNFPVISSHRADMMALQAKGDTVVCLSSASIKSEVDRRSIFWRESLFGQYNKDHLLNTRDYQNISEKKVLEKAPGDYTVAVLDGYLITKERLTPELLSALSNYDYIEIRAFFSKYDCDKDVELRLNSIFGKEKFFVRNDQLFSNTRVYFYDGTKEPPKAASRDGAPKCIDVNSYKKSADYLAFSGQRKKDAFSSAVIDCYDALVRHDRGKNIELPLLFNALSELQTKQLMLILHRYFKNDAEQTKQLMLTVDCHLNATKQFEDGELSVGGQAVKVRLEQLVSEKYPAPHWGCNIFCSSDSKRIAKDMLGLVFPSSNHEEAESSLFCN